MSKLIVNAPIQNSAFNPDVQLGKVIPLFVADHLRAMQCNGEEAAMPTYELWNNIVASQQAGHTAVSYKQHERSLLAAKYASETLKLLHSNNEPVQLTDDNADFEAWTLSRIEQAIHDGDAQINTEAVYACNGCEAPIALAEGPHPSGCGACGLHSGSHVAKSQIMTATITPEALARTSEAIHASFGTELTGRRFMVNKRRVSGLKLDCLGLPDSVIDPRVSVSILGAYAAEKSGASQVTMVASRSSMGHNLPQYFSVMGSQLADLPKSEMVGISKAPVSYFSALLEDSVLTRDALVQTIRDRVAPQLVIMRRDMTPVTAENIIFSRRRHKLDLKA